MHACILAAAIVDGWDGPGECISGCRTRLLLYRMDGSILTGVLSAAPRNHCPTRLFRGGPVCFSQDTPRHLLGRNSGSMSPPLFRPQALACEEKEGGEVQATQVYLSFGSLSKLTSFEPLPKPLMTLPSICSGYGGSGPDSGPTMSGLVSPPPPMMVVVGVIVVAGARKGVGHTMLCGREKSGKRKVKKKKQRRQRGKGDGRTPEQVAHDRGRSDPEM